MSWPTINDAAWDRFQEQPDEDVEAQAVEVDMHRKNREFYESTIIYEDGTVEVIDRGIIQASGEGKSPD